jgi:hypothetical protein
MSKIGNTSFSIRVGSSTVKAIYSGSNLIYSESDGGTPSAQSLILVEQGSSNVFGSGTSGSPYFVASNSSPSPIYQANVPGLLTVNFTDIRTGDYNCGKGGCETGRYNESVYFDRNDGNFYEQIRTNIDNFTTSTGFGHEAFLSRASRNTLTSISYPMHKGQRLRMSQHSVLPEGYRGEETTAADNNRQLTNARISFTPVDSNFSITAIGSRPLFGDGTAISPYCPQTSFSSAQNQRTMVFRANGSGVVAVYGIPSATSVPLNYDLPLVRVGGTANSFSGSVGKTKLDFFGFNSIPRNFIGRPQGGLFFIWVNDGEIFSFASEQSDKSGSWIQEFGIDPNLRTITVWAVPNSGENGLFLMNYAFPTAGGYAIGWQGNVSLGQTPVFWSGLGTSGSPASMNNWSTSLHNVGNAATIYTSLNGSISFDYSIESVGQDLFLSQWRTFGLSNPLYRFSNTNISNNASSGNATINTKAFRGIGFNSNSRFRITNLVFTPS